ncbi:uncharacterized protein LOC123443516 [Hordeum vulgare subsp. vulgare]|uniref:uncharacterized protein LOC123443516 n=1 Tax=Hordeum vulgare subsp. vulgare TaxID=112509 RepID=UPI00162E6AFD|nr:uncharacterized protein LOC123443516 [Hordeum vulgare subsp. vulgare]
MPDLGGADTSPIAVAPLPPDCGRTASSPTAAASPCQRTVTPHPVPDHGRLASRRSRWSAYGGSNHRHGVVLLQSLLPPGWPHDQWLDVGTSALMALHGKLTQMKRQIQQARLTSMRIKHRHHLRNSL